MLRSEPYSSSSKVACRSPEARVAARKIDGKWYADFRFQHADGSVERVRKRSPVQSKAGADEFEHQLRTALLAPTHTTKEVPTFAAYADDFKKTYVLANNKPSSAR